MLRYVMLCYIIRTHVIQFLINCFQSLEQDLHHRRRRSAGFRIRLC